MNIIKPIDFTLVSSTVADSAYAAWNSATAYSIGTNVVYTNHGEYKALTANTNKIPSANPTDWQFLGTTNRWKLFDQYLNTLTTATTSMQYVLTAYDAQAIFIGNLINIEKVRIEVIDNSNSAVIEDKTLQVAREAIDWYEYFFGAISSGTRKVLLYERTTITRDVSIRFTITGSGTIGIGTFIVGTKRNIGALTYGFSLSALDYSTVATDTASGVTFLSKGNYVKLLSGSAFVSTLLADAVYDSLVEIQGLPAIFYDGLDSTIIYGFIKKFDMPIKSPVETLVNIDIQGLI